MNSTDTWGPIPGTRFKSKQMPLDAIVVLMTAANREEALRLADMLVESNLAACVQILPEIRSVYRWEGEVERQTEVLLLVKTLHGKFVELEKQVRALHSYDVPEIVALPITSGSAPYLEWISASVQSSKTER